jgi:hypothetical protein
MGLVIMWNCNCSPVLKGNQLSKVSVAEINLSPNSSILKMRVTSSIRHKHDFVFYEQLETIEGKERKVLLRLSRPTI